MRFAWLSVALLLAAPGAVEAQGLFTIGDTLSPRVKVGSCPLADRLLGPATKNVLKAEIHGTFGPDSLFDLASGPINYRDEYPVTLYITELTAGHDTIPRGVLSVWFKGSILQVDRDPSKPFTVIADDSLPFPLGMPVIPIINGQPPSAVFFNAVVSSPAMQALLGAKKARVEFLGMKTDIRGRSLDEIRGANRLAICYRSGQGIVR